MVVAARPSSATLDALWTWEDVWELPEDGNLYEIIDGELYGMTPPIPVHQEVLTRAFRAFDRAAELDNAGLVYLAPIGVKLSDRDIVEPDLIFIACSRLSIVKDRVIDGPPDIVLEVFSPSTRAKDLNEKADLYARSGIPEYWQVDPRRRSIVVLSLVDGAYRPEPSTDGIARSRVLPGVAIPIAPLFENLT
jgi:Uma2 family endonuclease